MFQTLNSISAEKNSTIIFPLPIDLVRSVVEWECSSKNITVMIVNNQNHYDRVVEWRCSNIMKNITVIIVNNATMIVFCFLGFHHIILFHHENLSSFRCVKRFNLVKLFSVFFLIIVVLWSMWVTLPKTLTNLLEMKLVLIIIHITQRIMIESKQNLNHNHQTQWIISKWTQNYVIPTRLGKKI